MGCECWTMKKAEHQRIDAFELWDWRRRLRVSWIARRSHLSTLKEINTDYSLEVLTLKRKLQYFGHLMQRAYSLKKTDPVKNWRQKKKGRTENEMVGWHLQLNGHEFEQTLGDGEKPGELHSPWGHKELETNLWLNSILYYPFNFHSICGNAPLSLPILVICVIFLIFLVSLARILLILLNVQITFLWFYLLFILSSSFKFHWFLL